MKYFLVVIVQTFALTALYKNSINDVINYNDYIGAFFIALGLSAMFAMIIYKIDKLEEQISKLKRKQNEKDLSSK
jgi:membrane protein CcdC involved in cytochrome C biogenesis